MPLDLPSLDLTDGKATCSKRMTTVSLLRSAMNPCGRRYEPATECRQRIAVEAFLNGGIRFTDIAEIIRSTMDRHIPKDVESLEDALEADRWAREKAESLVVALAR